MKIIDRSFGIKEYVLGEVIARERKELPIKRKEISLNGLAELYSNEPLIEIGGQRFPVIALGKFNDLGDISAELSKIPYQIPKEFEIFRKEVVGIKVRPGSFDGKSVRVADFRASDKLNAKLQQIGYFDFISMGLETDAFLNQFDSSFPEGATLRDYDRDDNRARPLNGSVCANMLGAVINVFNEEESCFIMGYRQPWVAVYPDTLSTIGGTPEWKGLSEVGDFSKYMRTHIEEEMREELCLNPDEFEFRGGIWTRNFTRGPDITTNINMKIPMNDLVERCLVSEEAKKEHTSFFAVPMDRRTVNALASGNKEHKINPPSVVALDCALRTLE